MNALAAYGSESSEDEGDAQPSEVLKTACKKRCKSESKGGEPESKQTNKSSKTNKHATASQAKSLSLPSVDSLLSNVSVPDFVRGGQLHKVSTLKCVVLN